MFTYETANVKLKSSENFVQQMAKFWQFSGSGGQELEKVSIFTAKCTSIRGSTSFAIFRVKVGWGCDLQVGWGKIKKVTNIVYFTYKCTKLKFIHSLTAKLRD